MHQPRRNSRSGNLLRRKKEEARRKGSSEAGESEDRQRGAEKSASGKIEETKDWMGRVRKGGAGRTRRVFDIDTRK